MTDDCLRRRLRTADVSLELFWFSIVGVLRSVFPNAMPPPGGPISPQRSGRLSLMEDGMPDVEDGQVTATATEARQAERGPTVRNVLVISVVMALAVLAALWFVFFKT